uniref:glycoside hydrolase family 9 protein n=1 Tax=Pedobacter schmidteae TaxID=2201271 RepID=UPI000EAB4F11|nr:glycoside hydrolase family 9 protein [Pedobacter schmidteae]
MKIGGLLASLSLVFLTGISFQGSAQVPDVESEWIRINQLGYQPQSVKVAVWASKNEVSQPVKFEIIEKETGKQVYTSGAVKAFGAYGPFKTTCRLDFSDFKSPGRYFIKAGTATSPEVIIGADVYRHTADFALRYMRQQRSGFNPFLKDSCHTGDGYTMYGPMPDSTHIDVSGGWHDASDYLQYATTSANATYHLLAAYRDFPGSFSDAFQANGLVGKNGQADILDEANWGLQWLLKMHPKKTWLFNQIADDRDHQGLRLPNEDAVSYGKGKERPVYFANGKPQGLGRFQSRATGTASVAAKFGSAFALGSRLFKDINAKYAQQLLEKSRSAYAFGLKQPGVQQTAPNRAPYFYEEDNWTDDMELAAAELYQTTGGADFLKQAVKYAAMEPVTPWMGADTARHYQWYPFHNFGHYEIAKNKNVSISDKAISYYREGLKRVWEKAKHNVFYRGVPFVWCSNNLTASFAIQAYLYRKASGDEEYEELAQANFDWLFGCNPWGTSMVYGLPAWGDTPKDPHSAFTHLKQYPIDGGLVDGPVYGRIYKNLIGIKLYQPDEYAVFQSDLVVYHDDFGDYSTNEPTMDGTASLVYLLAAYDSRTKPDQSGFQTEQGGIIRGRLDEKKIALVFTGHEYGEGLQQIDKTLNKYGAKASFFFTGDFYRNPQFAPFIKQLKKERHYLGGHSDRHLLYCDWGKRDSLLISRESFLSDLTANYKEMARFGISKLDAEFFLPPYEWYNKNIADWTADAGFRLINYTPGTRSNADYTYPEMGSRYIGSMDIYQSIVDLELKKGMNGFLLLLHAGTDPRRKDKFYDKLEDLLFFFKQKGYKLVTVNDLLGK